MGVLDELLERTINELVPRLILERLFAEKIKNAGLSVDAVTLSQAAAAHIVSGRTESFKFDTGGDDQVTIEITDDDIEYVVKAIEQFHNERLGDVFDKASDATANLLSQHLSTNWPTEFEARQAEIGAFKERLEHRWGEALGKLRMLLAIVMEWSQELYVRRLTTSGNKLPHLDDVLLRLHVRACQVTNEIIVLLENGYADGAMARWRTLHEIRIIAAVIAKFGEEVAERYVYYQVVESFAALKAYERNHTAFDFKAVPKKQSAKIRADYAKVIQRFGRNFGKEYGWVAQHLTTTARERITFARLEEEAGRGMMRSPYQMASYNVHASPKGVYFKLGNIRKAPTLLAGASNAGLVEPAQHAAVSLAELTLLLIAKDKSPVIFDDLVVGKIVAQLEAEIPLEFARADRELRRDDRQTSSETAAIG
jgi:hypothetical protein